MVQEHVLSIAVRTWERSPTGSDLPVCNSFLVGGEEEPRQKGNRDAVLWGDIFVRDLWKPL